jgi:hypothetical protein
MKIQYKQILGSVGAYRELQNFKFPPKIALDIYKLGKELDRELEAYNELSRNIYKEHKVPEVDGRYNFEKMKPEDFQVFTKELEELLDAEAEIKDYHIPMSVFEKFNLNISPNMISALEWLIKPEESNEENSDSDIDLISKKIERANN